jgi:hypothetical protein
MEYNRVLFEDTDSLYSSQWEPLFKTSVRDLGYFWKFNPEHHEYEKRYHS